MGAFFWFKAAKNVYAMLQVQLQFFIGCLNFKIIVFPKLFGIFPLVTSQEKKLHMEFET
jgi:hypothetical protein